MPPGGARYRSGPPPTPTALKLLRGNPGGRPLPEAEPAYAVRLPVPPAELTAEAKRVWRREGRRLVGSRVMTSADAAAFAAFCSAYARWLELSAMLNRTGLVLKDERLGIRMNPLVQGLRDAQADYLRAAVEFGLTPSSRTRVHAAPAASGATGEWWEVTGGGR